MQRRWGSGSLRLRRANEKRRRRGRGPEEERRVPVLQRLSEARGSPAEEPLPLPEAGQGAPRPRFVTSSSPQALRARLSPAEQGKKEESWAELAGSPLPRICCCCCRASEILPFSQCGSSESGRSSSNRRQMAQSKAACGAQ